MVTKNCHTKNTHKKHIFLPYTSNHLTISHSPPASHHMLLENHLSTTSILRVVDSPHFSFGMFEVSCCERTNSDQICMETQIPRNIIFNNFTVIALWYIQRAFCGNETSHVYWVKSQKHQNKEMYLHCNICLGTHSTPTCWNPEPTATSKNPSSINWSTGAADKHEQYHYHHTLPYLVDGTSLHNNDNYRFILRSPNQKTVMSSW